MTRLWEIVRRWETLLVVILAVVLVINVNLSPYYLQLNNQINLFQLSIEKIMIALVMTLIPRRCDSATKCSNSAVVP